MTPSVSVNVRRFVSGFESESLDISFNGLPAGASDELMGEMLATASRAADVISAYLQSRSGQSATLKPEQTVKVDISAFDVPAQPVAVELTPQSATLESPTASQESQGATLELGAEAAAWYLIRPQGHPALCRCGECYDVHHDDANPYADHCEGCQCHDCHAHNLKKGIPGCTDVSSQTALADPHAPENSAEGSSLGSGNTVSLNGTGQPQESAGKSPEQPRPTCATCNKVKDPMVPFFHTVDGRLLCPDCNKKEGPRRTDASGPLNKGETPNKAGEVTTEPAPKENPEFVVHSEKLGPELASSFLPEETVKCYRCEDPVFGGGVEMAGETYCHACVRVKVAELREMVTEVAIGPDEVDIPTDAEVTTTIDILGIAIQPPPLEWANELITKTGGESDGGQCKALNTVLGANGYAGKDRHWATLAIISEWNPMRVTLNSLNDISRAEAHVALSWFDAADTEALIALHSKTQKLKGQIPLFLAEKVPA